MKEIKNNTDLSSLSMAEKYLEVLKKINGWITVSEWAIKFGEMFPELLAKADLEAKSHKKPSTGLREIAARISSNVSTGKFTGHIEVDESERPKRVRVLSDEAVLNYIESEIETDLEPLTRAQKIRSDESKLTVKERYRISEFEGIISQLKEFFNLDFELEHAKAILNPSDPGPHHPDNMQILLKSHNRTKSNSNWERFSIKEQIEYIEAVVKVQKIVSQKMGIDMEDDVIRSVVERIKLIY
jgi:hypothetical protein